jgi:thiol-disulfide isomerase/thioredoxin
MVGVRQQIKPMHILNYGWIGKSILLALVLIITLAACSKSSGTLNVAYTFPFTLYQGESELGGSNIDLSDLNGKPVVINFWAGLCPPCRAEMPDFQVFHDNFNGKVTIIGIDIGQYVGLGSQADARNLLNEMGFTYPAGFTEDPNVVKAYEVFGVPTTVFINSKGEVFRKWGGLLTLKILTDVSREMLALES